MHKCNSHSFVEVLLQKPSLSTFNIRCVILNFPYFKCHTERGAWKNFFWVFFKMFSVFFLFIISVTHSLWDEVLLSLYPFSKLSIHNIFFLLYYPDFCPFSFYKFSEDQHIKGSIWQGLDTISDNIFIVLLSLTVATFNSLGISCCLAFHLSQAAIGQRNIRARQLQKTL